MTHDETLRKVFGKTQRTIVDRIVKTYRAATPGMIESGARWYADGESFIDRMSAQTGLSRETVAAVVSHLSPRTTWRRNLEAATSVLLTGTATGVLSANLNRATVALASDDPLATLKGRKTLRFAMNLLGDREAVTIDVWALRVALGPKADDTLLSRKGAYEAMEHAYRVAGARLGVDPVTVQAVAWIVARGGRSQ